MSRAAWMTGMMATLAATEPWESPAQVHDGEGGAGASEAGDAMEARRLKGLGEGHRRQDGGEPPCQHRRARPRGARKMRLRSKYPHPLQCRESFSSSVQQARLS
jgi:hypothetical protein